jgi:hypothetical protein
MRTRRIIVTSSLPSFKKWRQCTRITLPTSIHGLRVFLPRHLVKSRSDTRPVAACYRQYTCYCCLCTFLLTSRLYHLHSLVPEELMGSNVSINANSGRLETSSFAPGAGGSNASSHSRRSSLTRATRKITGIFQRRKSTSQGRVLVNGGDLTDEPESMDASGESPVVPNHDPEPTQSRSWRAKYLTLPDFVRNIFQQSATTRRSNTAEMMGAAQPFI